jgi:hypothetical protein
VFSIKKLNENVFPSLSGGWSACNLKKLRDRLRHVNPATAREVAPYFFRQHSEQDMQGCVALLLVAVVAFVVGSQAQTPLGDWQYGRSTWYQGIDNGNCGFSSISAASFPWRHVAGISSPLSPLSSRFFVLYTFPFRSFCQRPTRRSMPTRRLAVSAMRSSASAPTTSPTLATAAAWSSRSPTAAHAPRIRSTHSCS